MKTIFLYFFLCITLVYSWIPEKHLIPEEFRFGVTTSAYQVEGAWDADGKGESVWDHYIHNVPNSVHDKTNGDEACDSYYNYKRDVEMLREMGVDFYRFSISWSRVLPTGFPNKINMQGLEYYQNLTDELYKYNINPMVTMYHYDLPQALQDLGGWTNPKIIEWFEDYARILYENLPRVKYWVTINQLAVCFDMYGGGIVPPAINDKGVGDYKCVKNMLLAHARAYKLFNKEFRKQTPALVGVAVSMFWADPLNATDQSIIETTRIFREFTIDLFLHPILSKEGGFPETVQTIVADNSLNEGLDKSRLPRFTKSERELLHKSTDFIGINYFSSLYVENPPKGKRITYSIWSKDVSVKLSQNELWEPSKTPWLRSASYGLYYLCMYINKKYNVPPLIVTEYGWSTHQGLNDTDRVNALAQILKAVLFCLKDGSDLRGIAIKSPMDGFEFYTGIRQRFGLYETDFDSPMKTRSPRLSAHFLRNVIETRMINEEYTHPTGNLTLSPSSRRLDMRSNKTDL